MCMLSGFPGLGRRMYKYGKVVNIRWGLDTMESQGWIDSE
jgi:hypothetical protein